MTFLVSVCIVSCRSMRTSSKNLSALYDSSKPYHLFQFSLYHSSIDTTQIHFRVPLHEFLYKRDDPGSSYKAKFSMTYYYYEDFNAREPKDSATFYYEDSLYFQQNYWQDYVANLPLGKYTEGLLKIEIVDCVKKYGATFTFFYDRTNIGNRQYFYAENSVYGRLPQLYVNSEDSFRIIVSPLLNPDSLTVYYFPHFTEIARPPYAVENTPLTAWRADSSFRVAVINRHTDFMNFKRPGLYHFMYDTSQRQGFTIYIHRHGFPFIITHEDMLEPLRYISTQKEFNRLEDFPDTQYAVDEFWLNSTSNVSMAQKQIKDFYNKVQYANIFFTSYKEGWRTDRGMLYIVFGQPSIVYRNGYREIWIYGEDRNFNSAVFEFRKVINPLTDNDYSLMRNPTFKETWFRAVEMWRR